MRSGSDPAIPARIGLDAGGGGPDLGRSPINNRARILAKGTVGLAIACAALAGIGSGAFPRTASSVLSCTNPASGAYWQVRIDFAHRRAGSFPAEITKRRISWHDTVERRYYDLDRISGKLVVRFASSTGGSFIYDECRIGK